MAGCSPGELASRRISPGSPVDCTITCAKPLKRLRFQGSLGVTILTTAGLRPPPRCSPRLRPPSKPEATTAITFLPGRSGSRSKSIRWPAVFATVPVATSRR